MEYVNSCLMLSATLWTGIDLLAAFNEEDLIDSGIERDSHITIFFAPDKVVPKEGLLENIETILGLDVHMFKNNFTLQNRHKVLDYFELGFFENDRDFLVLKLQDNDEYPWYNWMKALNSGLVSHYNIESNFKNYTPHLTLAQLQPGKAKNYMFSPVLNQILKTAEIQFDDLVLSYGDVNGGFKQYNITSYNAVSRYFRQKELEKDGEYYENNL